jgi:hypothetical protein
MKYTLSFFIALLFPLHQLLSQSLTHDAEMETEITSLLLEDDAANAAERLSELSERPVDINNNDEEELARLFFLTDFQIRVLSDYVRNNGKIVSIYEIALLPGFDRPTAMLMEPYITLSSSPMKTAAGGGMTTLLVSMMINGPASDEDSTGIRSVLRFRHSGKRFSYGLTAENDPWEKITFNGAAGADFVSAHFMYIGKKKIDKLILGDYSLRFGEGLVVNNNSWQGGWLTSPSFMTGRAVLSPYTSTDENNFFRGAGLVIGSLTKGAVLFASINAIDGRLYYSTDSSSRYITNLLTGGLHNSESGEKARNSLTENVFGAHITYGGERIRGGITVAATFFSLPFQPDTTQGENLYKFSGDHLVNIGVDIKAGTGKLFYYGEAAYSIPGSWACVTGIRSVPSERITINLLARYLAPGYHVFHSNIYGAGSSVSNEMGLAGNMHVEVAKHLFLSAGADIYHFPWLRYRSSAPSVGTRSEIKAEYTPSNLLTIRASWSIIQREYDVDDETGIADTEIKKRLQASLFTAWSPSSDLLLTSRVLWCHIPETKENGYLLCQDLSYSLQRLKFWFRYSLYTTDGWDTRLYAYENDMLHSFSLPPLYNDGSRAYIMTEWDISEKILLRAKYAVTLKQENEDRTAINDWRIQMKIVF